MFTTYFVIKTTLLRAEIQGMISGVARVRALCSLLGPQGQRFDVEREETTLPVATCSTRSRRSSKGTDHGPTRTPPPQRIRRPDPGGLAVVMSHKEKTRGDEPAGQRSNPTAGLYYTTSTPWLRKTAAAEHASVSTSTIDQWRLEGLPYHLVGGTVLIDRLELDTFIREHRARVVARRNRRRGGAR